MEAESAGAEPANDDLFAAARADMVETGVVGWGIEDQAVIEAMGAVPRHEFVPEEFLPQAYNNHPLPIGLGQTISQPYIVALMTHLLDLKPGGRVLEIGDAFFRTMAATELGTLGLRGATAHDFRTHAAQSEGFGGRHRYGG